MAPTVRIDDDVWQWLQGLARPFEDTPNSVLRRVAGLDGEARSTQPRKPDLTIESARGTSMLKRFTTTLESLARGRNAEVRIWGGGTRRSSNVIELRREASSRLLYVRTRTESDGFWGVRANLLEAFAESGLEWTVVFLVGPGEKTYAMASDHVLDAIRKRKWSFGSAGDYKVHERTGNTSDESSELSGASAFNTYSAFGAAVLGSSRQRSNDR